MLHAFCETCVLLPYLRFLCRGSCSSHTSLSCIRCGCSPTCPEGRSLRAGGRWPTVSDLGWPDSQLQRLAERVAAGLAIDGRTACQYRRNSRLLGAVREPARSFRLYEHRSDRCGSSRSRIACCVFMVRHMEERQHALCALMGEE